MNTDDCCSEDYDNDPLYKEVFIPFEAEDPDIMNGNQIQFNDGLPVDPNDPPFEEQVETDINNPE